MPRLNAESLSTLEIPTPTYDRSALRTGIVHFGVGGFHRAHQAMYLDTLMNSGQALDWAICGVGVLPFDRRMHEVMQAQDCLYTLVVKHPDGRLEPRVIGSIADYLFAPDDPEAVVARMADPGTRIVSLTVTEGGYHVHPVTGEFDDRDENIQHDLQGPGRGPAHHVRLHHRGAAPPPRRRHRPVHRDVLRQHPGQRRRGAQDDHRVRPAAGPRAGRVDRARGAVPELDGRPDHPGDQRRRPGAAGREVRRAPTAGRWSASRSRSGCWRTTSPTAARSFDAAGVQLVPDVMPYELMKLRLLNASHQALCYLGYLAGYRYAHEVCQDELFADFLLAYMNREATPTLLPVPGVDLEAYKPHLIERFANPEVRDTLARLCAETSDRIPKWLLPVIRHNLEHGGEIDRAALVVAAWARYAEGVDEQGEPITVVDRLSEQLTATAQPPARRAAGLRRPTRTCSATWPTTSASPPPTPRPWTPCTPTAPAPPWRPGARADDRSEW